MYIGYMNNAKTKWVAEVIDRTWSKEFCDQYMYDGWCGETASEAVLEALLRSGLDEGTATDRLADCEIIVVKPF